MRLHLLTAFAFIYPFALSAQSLSVDDLQKQIDEEITGKNEYQDLLSDPDPQRSMAAMKIMMRSGEPDLERMAREFGLYSTSSQVRRTALEAYLNSEPILELWIDGTDLEDDQIPWFENAVSSYRGSLNKGPTGFFSLPVGKYDEKLKCWVLEQSRNPPCLARLSEESVSIFWFQVWANFLLNDEGHLVGQMVPPNVKVPVPASIAVTR